MERERNRSRGRTALYPDTFSEEIEEERKRKRRKEEKKTVDTSQLEIWQ